MQRLFAITILFLLSSNAFGFTFMSTGEFTPLEGECYGLAMIGYDSVINSRLNVKAEHAIGLTDKAAERNVIWNAYLWKHSPHEYAIKTYSTCLTKK